MPYGKGSYGKKRGRPSKKEWWKEKVVRRKKKWKWLKYKGKIGSIK